jgi:predicted DsbA family dithiol-disulfide isomerase
VNAHPFTPPQKEAQNERAREVDRLLEDEFHHRMFRAYFYENRTISDADVMSAIAGEAGLDTTDFATNFAEQRAGLERAVINDVLTRR